MTSKYGEDVDEPWAHDGLVTLPIREFSEPESWLYTKLTPDEARLLGLRLIKMTDEAERQEW
ncbi:hypothetical protein ACFQ8W_00375 [Streptomyces sp. NPDC056508]|uniref:hypothetical protein n=1 Tax=Streptomyces sp. NPDC056508 TaxID=3345845 RepID=UPI00369793E2